MNCKEGDGRKKNNVVGDFNKKKKLRKNVFILFKHGAAAYLKPQLKSQLNLLVYWGEKVFSKSKKNLEKISENSRVRPKFGAVSTNWCQLHITYIFPETRKNFHRD